jgi:hypothetical protein
MYSFHDYNQAASRREAMTAARYEQEPQVIAAAMPAQSSLSSLLASLLSLIISPLFIHSIISLIIIVSLVLILLGL